MRGAGRVVFAAILLLLVGTLNIIYGIGALDDANFYANDTRYILTNLNALGWVLIIVGIIELTGGFSLMAGNVYGRVIGVDRRQPRRDRGAVLDGRRPPVLVARHLRPLRLDRLRAHRLRPRGAVGLGGARPPSARARSRAPSAGHEQMTAETEAGSQRSEDRAAREPKHRHRALVWALVVLASIVLVVSMVANWVQTELLDSGQFSNSTDEILQNKDVQEQLSIFAVDQLYANVDVQAQIEQKLPPPAQPLAAPVTAATRQLATNVAETALASPRVQQLIATAINGAQQRFVSLIENKGQFVSTQGGDVTLEYGSFVADVATRLGRRSLDDLPDPGLHPAVLDGAQAAPDDDAEQDRVHASNALPGAGGHAHPAGATEPHDSRNGCRRSSTRPSRASGRRSPGIQPKAPAQLQSRLSDLQGRLTKLDKRLTTVQGQAAAVIKDPEPGEHPQARPHARLASDARHRPAQPSGGSAPGRGRHDEVRRTERPPGPREGAAQPRLRAAGAGARALPGGHLPGEELAAGGTDRSRRRDPGCHAAHPAG